MSSLESLVNNDPIRLMEWGVTGSGKTSLAGACVAYEEFRPMYVFDWDLRIASLQKTLPQELWKFIEVEPYRDDSILGNAFSLMQAKIEQLPRLGFKTALVDSMSFMMTGVMNRVMALDGKTATTIPQLQHYNAQKSLVIDLIGRLLSKPLNVIITCHEDTDKDEVTGRLFKAVDLTGKLAGKMPGYFNEFWHTEIVQQTGKDPAFMVRTQGDMIYAARTAHKLLPVENSIDIWRKISAERQLRREKGAANASAITQEGTGPKPAITIGK